MKFINKLFVWFAAFFIISLTGCATSPQMANENIQPQSQPSSSNSSIIFYRPSGIFGYGQRHDILLDGKKVGRSTPGTKFSVDAAPGIHQVTVPHALYSGETLVSILVRSGEITYVRTSVDLAAFAGRAKVEQIDASKGSSEAVGLEVTKN
jgi:hypothetical protein